MRLLQLVLTVFFFVLRCHPTVLRDFQVTQPPIVPHDVPQCTIEVLRRDFAFSFGSAEVVELVPPTECGPLGTWAAITLNLTVTSNGTQFDRLGIFTFQNVEIWRTSTPEPTRGDGIVWTYIKDVSQYTPLFTKPGTFIFQLDNLIQPGLDGIYSAVVHATFYGASATHPPVQKADLIIPLSTLSNTTGDDASVPPGFSLNVTFPRNAVQAYAEIFASGNGQEETWYFNAVNEFLTALPSGITLGQGPFREVRLLIDGQVAGVAFPYAVIFTGGFVPSSWRPIVSYGALDLPTYFLDITPFIPLLTDGKPHVFMIDVASSDIDHTILQNWFVSGLLQVVVDTSGKPTTGNITVYDASLFSQSTNTGHVEAIGEVDISVKATRKIHIEADITSGSGRATHAVWSQDLSFTNHQTYRNNATLQTLRQTSTGQALATHNGVPVVIDIFSYPLDINFTYLSPDLRNWTTYIDHSFDRVVLPNPLTLRSTIYERQVTDGFFQLATGGNFGNGTNYNNFSYVDSAGNTYSRRVDAALNVITFDHQDGTLASQHNIEAGLPSTPGSSDGSLVYVGARLPGGRKTGP